jgi:predicted XRE-type DNA-binding protein
LIGSAKQILAHARGEISLPTKTAYSEPGSGNVFADIGMPNPEEALAKSELARRIAHALRSGWDDPRPAQLRRSRPLAHYVLGISKEAARDLDRGRLGRFSLDELKDFAKRAESE